MPAWLRRRMRRANSRWCVCEGSRALYASPAKITVAESRGGGAGVAAAATLTFAPLATADPVPPPCVNPDGTPCASLGTAGPGGASGGIPGGPQGSAGPGGASGSLGPGGPSGTANWGGVSGCLPNIGCASFPLG